MDTQTLEPSDIETCAATLPTTNAERLLKDLTAGRNYIKRQFDVYDKAIPRIQPLLAELSEECSINSYGGTMWFTTHQRSDIQVLLQLAPRWEKKTEGDEIRYIANVDGVPYWVTARDSALPDTCKLVEREVEIPAQPARISKVMMVECST
jgi:hypothetical protein